MQCDRLSRHEILQNSIRHLNQLLEAELATIAADARAPTDESINSGWTALMAHDTALPPRIVMPYEQFFEGVSVGYERDDDSVWVVVDFEPAAVTDVGVKATQRRAPKLRVHPVYWKEFACSWMSLEVSLHDLNLQDANTMRVSLLSNFDFKSENQALHTNVARMILRADKADGSYEDLNIGFFPITTMPLSHMLILNSDRLDLQRMDAAVKYRVIIFLPIFGDYTFNLYDLLVEMA